MTILRSYGVRRVSPRPRASTCVTLLCALAVVAAAQTPTSAPVNAGIGRDARPRLAVAGFTPDPNDDERNRWIALGLEELLSQRLCRVPELVVIPTLRVFQARAELEEPGQPPPEWGFVARQLSASHMLSGRCSGPDNAVAIELTWTDLRDPAAQPRRLDLPADRLFKNLDLATTWVLKQFGQTDLPRDVHERVFAPPARSPTAIEYYARSLAAQRRGDNRDALRYAVQSLDSDRRFRPSLLLLAKLEFTMGPSGRGVSARRFRTLGEMARLEHDNFDRVRAEIGQALVLQADGVFEAARTRIETALRLAAEQRDLYGQLAAMTAMCDLLLLRPLPLTEELTTERREEMARENAEQAARWQAALVDALAGMGDVVAEMPACNKLALIYDRLGRADQALEMHKRTLELAERLGSRVHQATAWLYLGQWNSAQQRWDEALKALNRCLELADDASKPKVRMAIGEVYRSMGMHEEALAQFEQAYEQVRASDSLDEYACLRELAAARMRLGRREDAISALKRAILIADAYDLPEKNRLRDELAAWDDGS